MSMDHQTPSVEEKINQIMQQFGNRIAENYFIGQDEPINLVEEAKFIVIEGMDYSGKTTLAKQLAEKLEQTGKKVKIFQNPGGELDDFAGMNLRGLIKQKVWSEYPDVACTLFLANRLYLHHRIKEAIAEGYVCIVDRWDLSAHVYQAPVGELKDNFYYRDIPLQEIKLALPQPDLMIVLHPSYEVVERRYQTRPDRGEYEAYKTKSPEELKLWYDKTAKDYLEISAGLTASFRWKHVVKWANESKTSAEDNTDMISNEIIYQSLPMFNQTDRMAAHYTLQYMIHREGDKLGEDIWKSLNECHYNVINTNPTQEEIDALREQLMQQQKETETHETKNDDTSLTQGEQTP